MSEEKALPTTPKGWNESCGHSFTIEVSQPVYDHLMGFKTKEQIVEDLVFSSWWASWLPFDWMHNLAAMYFVRKAERLYSNQERTKISTTFITGTVPGTKELNGMPQKPKFRK